MAKTTPRVFHQQMVHYIRKTVNFNDTGIGTSVYAGTLPNGAQIIDAVTNVETAFNAGSTNVLTAGITGAGYTDIIGSADVTEATPGGYRAAILTAGTKMAADSDVFVRYTQTGGAATTGKATIVITYAVNNDG